MELTDGQKRAIRVCVERYRNHEAYTVIAGAAGTGKAQPVDTEIPTPNGKRMLGDLSVGDYVYNRYGNPCKVLGIYPQGELDVFKVTLADGRSTYCNDGHLWTYYTKKNNLCTIPLGDMIANGIKRNGKSGYRYKIPVAKGIQYPDRKYEIDPYVIGAFLGNGCCRQRQLTLSSNDEEVVKEVAKLIGANKYCKNSEKNYNWTFCYDTQKVFVGGCGTYTQYKFNTKDFFKNFKEVCGYSYEKRIPREYMTGSIEQRLHLLQGLLDTDGSISCADGDRYNIRYTSTSYGLIKDIYELLLSLGYISTITEDKRVDKYTSGACYNLNINVPNDEKYKLFRLTRKKQIADQATVHKKHRKYDRVAIVDVEKMPYKKDMVCIYVDDDEHLYLTNDNIVTHNTTVIQHIIDELGLNNEDVTYNAYTGKASLVLRNKNCPNATTLHQLLYRPVEDEETGEVHYEEKLSIGPYKLIVVDEVSMVDDNMFKLLLSHRVHVICLGDMAQLPPVGSDKCTVLNRPHVVLTEVVRTSLDSPILALATDIRNGGKLSFGGHKDARVIHSYDVSKKLLLGADAIICATNKFRHELNTRIRELRWEDAYQDYPIEGDKIIALKNNWNVESTSGNPLINGVTGVISDISMKDTKYFHPCLKAKFTEDDGGEFKKLRMDYNLFTTGVETINKDNFKEFPKKQRLELFDYAYAISAWKSQGSQYGRVLVFEENFPREPDMKQRYLYTAITRATQQVIIVKKG